MTPKEMQSASHLRIFTSYYKPHMRLFLLDMTCALLIAAVDLLFPYLSKRSMETFLPGRMYVAFFLVMGGLLAAYLLKMGLKYVVTYWGHILGVRIESDIRTALFRHMQNLSVSFFDRNRTGQLMSRVTGDLFEITELAHHGPEDLFISCITLFGSLAFLFTIRWELALTLFSVLPFFVLFTVIRRRKLLDASAMVKQQLAGINSDLESSLSGIRTAKAFANEQTEIDRFESANVSFRSAKAVYYKAMASYFSGLEFFMNLMGVIVIALGGFFIMQGKMDFIELTTFTLYVATFISPIRNLSAFTELFMQGMSGFTRFVELMRTEPEIQDAPDAAPLTEVAGDIRIEDVVFTYAGDDDPVLRGLSLHVMPGETIAVVGPSGGGKSTLCQLIPRFYDVDSGRILIDGKDVRSLAQHSLREQIGVVQQDVFLFAGTIYDNIRYGRPDATEAEIVDAARRAEIYADILDMPDGLQTEVGERGVLLSGGQKQRISIARVFLKDPPILVLDEATSALDSITESKIQSAFDALARDRTTLIIAHRLSTIRSANRVIVIEDGRITEEGSHEQLIGRGGAYAALRRTQQGE